MLVAVGRAALDIIATIDHVKNHSPRGVSRWPQYLHLYAIYPVYPNLVAVTFSLLLLGVLPVSILAALVF